MADENKVLKINIGDEYKAKVEGIGDFNKSVFVDVYKKAFESVNTILSNKDQNNSKDDDSYEKYNNIIAFVGERGTGKTSAMLSVSKALKNDSYKKLEGFYKFEKIWNFEDVGIIDPSHFEEQSNILEIILAKMFKKFKNKVEENNSNGKLDVKRNLLDNFEKVFKNLKTISNPKKVFDGEAIDSLLEMSASTDLKENMSKLIYSYLEFMDSKNESGKDNNNILLLEIDDIDLNTKHAYEMVEQVRKYLIIPRVVILMAVKLEQLIHIVERNSIKEFKDLLDRKTMEESEPRNIAEKYLEKLIPLERRMFLPSFDNINLDINIEIYLPKDENGEIKKEDKFSDEPIEKVIRKLIYEKTGNMFFNSETQKSLIIPRNLRELIGFIMKLIKMENPEGNREIKDRNFKEFESYFLNNWLEQNLSNKYKNIVKEIYSRDVEEKNKYTVNILEEVFNFNFNFKEKQFNDDRYNESKDFKEFSKITNSLNEPSDISLGDVLFSLQLIEKIIKHKSDKLFIFSIKTLYSLMLYGRIREIKEVEEKIENLKDTLSDEEKLKKIKNNYKNNKIEKTEEEIKKCIENKIEKFQKEKIKKIFVYQKLINGIFINYRRNHLVVDITKEYNKEKLKKLSNESTNWIKNFLFTINTTTTTIIIKQTGNKEIVLKEIKELKEPKEKEPRDREINYIFDTIDENKEIEITEYSVFDYLGFLFHCNNYKNNIYIGNMEVLEKIQKYLFEKKHINKEYFHNRDKNASIFLDVNNFLEKLLKFFYYEIQKKNEFIKLKENDFIKLKENEEIDIDKFENEYLKNLFNEEVKNNINQTLGDFNENLEKLKLLLKFDKNRINKNALIGNIDKIIKNIEKNHFNQQNLITNILNELAKEIDEDKDKYDDSDRIILELKMKYTVLKEIDDSNQKKYIDNLNKIKTEYPKIRDNKEIEMIILLNSLGENEYIKKIVGNEGVPSFKDKLNKLGNNNSLSEEELEIIEKLLFDVDICKTIIDKLKSDEEVQKIIDLIKNHNSNNNNNNNNNELIAYAESKLGETKEEKKQSGE